MWNKLDIKVKEQQYSIISQKKKMSTCEQKDHMGQLDRLAQMNTAKMSQKRLEVAGKMSYDLVSTIEKEIQGNQLQVNDVQKSFKLKQKSADQQSRRINNLLHKGQEIQSGLDQIGKEEENIHILSHSRSERKYFKSVMTEQDRDKIKRMKMQHKKYELKLEQRAKMYEEQMKKLQEKQRQLLEKQKKEKNEEHLKEVAKKIEEIKKRQEERAKKSEEENKKILELKHQKKLHEKLEQHYKTIEQQEQRKKQELKIALKVQRKVDFDEIKQHEKKYEEIMRGQRQEREKKLGQLSRTNIKKYQHASLIKQVLQQEEKAKKQHIEKFNEIKQKLSKKEQYAEYVRSNYLPSLPLKQDDQDRNKSSLHRPASITQIRKMGNEYMKKAHQNLNLKASNVSKVEKKQEPFKYKDYLKDMRVGRHSQHKENTYLQEIDNLMEKQNVSKQQKLRRARLVALRLEEKERKDQQKMIESINAKIHLLQKIER